MSVHTNTDAALYTTSCIKGLMTYDVDLTKSTSDWSGDDLARLCKPFGGCLLMMATEANMSAR